MNGILAFIIGCFVGGFIGVMTMCLLQINRLNHYEMKNKKEDEPNEEKL